MAGVEQMKKKLLPLLNMDASLAPGMSIDASASYKVGGSFSLYLFLSSFSTVLCR